MNRFREGVYLCKQIYILCVFGCFVSSIFKYSSIFWPFFINALNDFWSSISLLSCRYLKFANRVSANSEMAMWGRLKNSQFQLFSLLVKVASS